MATVSATDDILVVTCGSKVLTIRMNEENLHVVEPPGIKAGTSDDCESGSESEDTSACIIAADLSRCSRWLALSSSKKQLSLWNTTNWSLVSNRTLARASQKVKFIPSGKDLVVADKSGDAYLFSVQEPNDEGRLLLGHLSMLLDVLITDNEQFIITCDRDEKIRVSCFPNAYHIQSYCLGHTEFVSSLSFLSHQPSILLSTSGDGTLRFWDYILGLQKEMVNCAHIVKDFENNPDIKENEEKGAVTQVNSCFTGSFSSVVVCVAGFKGCIIYNVSSDDDHIKCSLVQVLPFAGVPWHVYLTSSGLLWNVTCNECEPLGVLCLDSAGHPLNPLSKKPQAALALVNEYKQCFGHIQPPELARNLYKRKVDNIQEYFSRKKARLAKMSS